MSGYDEDFVGSGAESDGDSDEAPGTVTPPSELVEKDSRGKKKGKSTQGTTPAKSIKPPKQAPAPKPKKAAAPKTPNLKKTAAPETPATKTTSTPNPKKPVMVPRKTPAVKKSDTPKQPCKGKQSSAGKYADLKRAVKPKKAVAEGKTELTTVTSTTSIDTPKLQTPSRPTPPPSERLATSPNANTDERETPVSRDVMNEPRPESLPRRPPRPELSINPMWVPMQEATGSLPPGPPSLPPRPPTPLAQQLPSRSIFQPGAQPGIMFTNNNNNNSLLNNEPNFFSSSTSSHLTNNDPSFFNTSNSIPNGFPPTRFQQTDPWQVAPQPSPFLSALPGMQANLTLPSMGAGLGMGAYSGYPPPTPPGTSLNPEWEEPEGLFARWNPPSSQ